jgi:REP element-mobilizing transposase RayT
MYGKRRSIRLKGYDYSENGLYFVTIDLESKKNLLWKKENIFKLNEIGILMEKIILEIPIYYSGILIDEYIIMPNHMHLIIIINKGRKWDSDGDNAKGRKWDSDGDNAKGRKWDSARTLNQNIVGADPRIRPNNQINSNLSLSEVIQRFKILSTNQYIKGIKHQNWPKFFKRLWQRNYYERIIRDNKEYLAVKKYIRNNPDKLLKTKNPPAAAGGF